MILLNLRKEIKKKEQITKLRTLLRSAFKRISNLPETSLNNMNVENKNLEEIEILCAQLSKRKKCRISSERKINDGSSFKRYIMFSKNYDKEYEGYSLQ